MIKDLGFGLYLVDTELEANTIHNRQYGCDFTLELSEKLFQELKAGKILVNDGGEYTQEIIYKGGVNND